MRVLGPALIQAEEPALQKTSRPIESMDFAVEYDALIDLMVEGFEDTFGDKEL